MKLNCAHVEFEGPERVPGGETFGYAGWRFGLERDLRIINSQVVVKAKRETVPPREHVWMEGDRVAAGTSAFKSILKVKDSRRGSRHEPEIEQLREGRWRGQLSRGGKECQGGHGEQAPSGLGSVPVAISDLERVAGWQWGASWLWSEG